MWAPMPTKPPKQRCSHSLCVFLLSLFYLNFTQVYFNFLISFSFSFVSDWHVFFSILVPTVEGALQTCSDADYDDMIYSNEIHQLFMVPANDTRVFHTKTTIIQVCVWLTISRALFNLCDLSISSFRTFSHSSVNRISSACLSSDDDSISDSTNCFLRNASDSNSWHARKHHSSENVQTKSLKNCTKNKGHFNQASKHDKKNRTTSTKISTNLNP